MIEKYLKFYLILNTIFAIFRNVNVDECIYEYEYTIANQSFLCIRNHTFNYNFYNA
jgi:hypothetical protein